MLWRCGGEGQGFDVENWREDWNKRGRGGEDKRCEGVDAMEERKGETGIGDKRERERLMRGIDEHKGECIRRTRLGEVWRSLGPREGAATVR